jgi:branched-chain amino acid transport system substrate-binding protein
MLSGRYTATGLFLLFLTALLFVATSCSTQTQEPIKIGAVFSVTGPASFLGEPEKNTVLMLRDQINKAGGINGRPIEIIIEDSKSDESQAVVAAKKLIEKEKVLAIIGPSTTGESMALVPIVTAAKVPMISCAAGAAITQPVADRFWVFKTAQYDTSAVERIFDYMKGKGITSIGIVSVSTSFGDAGRKALLQMAPSYGIQIVADETYGPKDTDMTAQLVKIKSAGARAIINWSVGPGQAIITKNWASLDMKIPLYQSHGWGSKKNIELAESAAEGVIAPVSGLVVWTKIPDSHPQKAVLKKYATDYQALYKIEPSAFGGYAHDALLIAVEAIKKAGTDRGKIRDYIETGITKWIGASGIFNISKNDHTGLTKDAFEMVIVRDKDWALLN